MSFIFVQNNSEGFTAVRFSAQFIREMRNWQTVVVFCSIATNIFYLSFIFAKFAGGYVVNLDFYDFLSLKIDVNAR